MNCAVRPGGGRGVGTLPLCWVSGGGPLRQLTARPHYRYPGVHRCWSAWRLWPSCCGEGGRLQPPLRAVGLVARSGRPHWARRLCSRVGLGGIALGPLSGVWPGPLGVGCPRREARPFVACFPFCVLYCLLAARTCLQPFMLHHARLDHLSLGVLRGSCGLHQGPRPPIRSLACAYCAGPCQPLPFRYDTCACRHCPSALLVLSLQGGLPSAPALHLFTRSACQY